MSMPCTPSRYSGSSVTAELLTNLDGLRPLVRDEDVALVGYRVLDDNDHFLGEHIRSTAITVVDLSELRETGTGRALDKALATVTSPSLPTGQTAAGCRSPGPASAWPPWRRERQPGRPRSRQDA